MSVDEKKKKKKRYSTKKNDMQGLCALRKRAGGEGISIQKKISLDFIWTGALLLFRVEGIYTALSLTSVSGPQNLICTALFQSFFPRTNGCAACRKFAQQIPVKISATEINLLHIKIKGIIIKFVPIAAVKDNYLYTVR